MSDAEIASDMGISQGTVRSTTHRALAALGVALKEAP
jgi:DNA-directed RNA polymerase specialized sigma24 family protein